MSWIPAQINLRGWRLLQLVGAAVLVIGTLAISIGAITAGASGPGEGTIVPSSAVPGEAYTADTPFSSGQQIDVQIPANSLFTSNENINILECTTDNGSPPPDVSFCDGNTIQGVSLKPKADGSIDLHAQKNAYYTLYALPDQTVLQEGASGPACNLTNECFLYIGVNQNDFTQAHVWSQGFYVSPNADDQGENPGDGSAPPPPALPSPSLSTLTASAPTATADGEDSDTITATLLATGGLAVSGRTVSLAQGTGQSKITVGSNVSSASGQVTFTVTDSTTEPVTYSATDTTDAIPITQAAAVIFQAPVVTPAHSTVDANPTNVPADGATTSTITVTLRDQAAQAQPVAGKSVTLSQGGSHSVISPPTAISNAQGVATFTVTDSTVERATYSAADSSDSIPLTATTAVTFGMPSVSPATSTITSVSPAEAGAGGTLVTVTLLAANSDPISGKNVTVTASSGTTTVVDASAGSATTGNNGQATFTVSDTVAETVVLHATDSSDAIALSNTASVVFEPPAASATESTITAGATTAPADGLTKVGIQVVITDQFGNPLEGKAVTLSGSPDPESALGIVPIESATPGVTDSKGAVQFDVDGTNAAPVTFTATDTTDGITLTNTVVVTFQAVAADANASTVVASPVAVAADGTTKSTITVTLKDHFGNPLSGRTITLAATGGSSAISPATSPDVTGADGQAVFTVDDATPEVVGYVATDATDNLELNEQAVVTFGSPPVPPPVAADCALIAGPSSVPADGTSAATITVMLYDANSNPVAGQTVSLAASGGSSVITATSANASSVKGAVTATSATTGAVTFTVSDTAPETVTYSATDTSQNPALVLGQTVTVTFTQVQATTGTTTTTTTTPTTAAAGASSTSTTVPVSTLPPASTGTSSGGSSGGESSGSSGSTSSGTSLAFTGAPTLSPWLVGLGALLLVLGSVGRRLTRRRSP